VHTLFSSLPSHYEYQCNWCLGRFVTRITYYVLNGMLITRRSSVCCTLSMERTPHWSLQASSDTVSFTFTYHPWQFIIFTIFTTIAIFVLSYSFSVFHSELKTRQFGKSRLFPLLPDWFHGLSDHLTFFFCSMAGFVCMVCWTKPTLSRFSRHLKSVHFHSFIH